MNSGVLITGGAGFIGSHIARLLLEQGERVCVADDLSSGHKRNLPPEADFRQLDLRDPGEYAKLEGLRPRAVMHLAAQSSGTRSFHDPQNDFSRQAPATFNLLRWCLDQKVERFLYASSSVIYGDSPQLPVKESAEIAPKSYYAAGKAAGEAYVRLFNSLGLRSTIFRMPNVYGPGQDLGNLDQGMASIYLAYMLRGEPVEVRGSLERFRDFIHVSDVAAAWREALYNEAACGQTYNLASGVKTSVAELLAALKQGFGQPDYPIRLCPGTPGDQLGVYSDISKITRELGWRPKFDLRSGIADTVSREMAALKSEAAK